MDPLPSNFQFLLILLVLLMVLVTYRYLSRRSPHPTRKQLNVDSPSGSEATDSEPVQPEVQVVVKEKPVDKMVPIPEENNENYNSTDSEEYSMQRMVEEYNKNNTFKKKVSGVLEDISDVLKRKSIEIKRQFGPAPTPDVIRPMSMQERLAKLNQNKKVKTKVNSKSKRSKKGKKRKKERALLDENKQLKQEEVNRDDYQMMMDSNDEQLGSVVEIEPDKKAKAKDNDDNENWKEAAIHIRIEEEKVNEKFETEQLSESDVEEVDDSV
eukprot:12675_1